MAAAGAVFFAVYLWNVIRSPYDISQEKLKDEIEKNNSANAEISVLKTKLEEVSAKKPQIILTVHSSLYGGGSEKLGGGNVAYAIMCRVSNVGQSPTTIVGWAAEIEYAGMVEPIFALTVLDFVSMNLVGGQKIKLLERDQLDRICRSPIAPATAVDGYFFFLIKAVVLEHIDSGVTTTLKATDIYGNVFTGKYELGRNHGFIYNPIFIQEE